jgi:LysR family hydrogen peroxide-inducible transcriptional activator
MKLMPTVKQMQYLLALADTLHFGEAAKKCFVTQSTLSAGIRDLEIVLNLQIAERTKRSVRLTSAGRDIVERSRIIILQTAEMLEAASVGQELLCGKMHLGIIPTIAPFLLPVALPVIRNKFPSLELMLIEDESANIVESLQKGDLDVIIYALPYSTVGLQNMNLFEDEFYLTIPSNHKLAKRKSVQLSDFADEEMLLLNHGHCLRDHALAVCSSIGHEQARSFDGTSLHTIVQMVAGGIGVTLLPQMAVKSGIARHAGLATIPVNNSVQARTIALAWRKTSPRSADFNALGSLLTSSMTA